MLDLVSLSVYLKSAKFLLDQSENSQPIRGEDQRLSSDWLRPVVTRAPERNLREEM